VSGITDDIRVSLIKAGCSIDQLPECRNEFFSDRHWRAKDECRKRGRDIGAGLKEPVGIIVEKAFGG
jgi:hypothetical protein